MHRKSSCLGPCALLIFFALIHTTNGSPESVLLRRKREVILVRPSYNAKASRSPLPRSISSFRFEDMARQDSYEECPPGPGFFKCHSGNECQSIYDSCDGVRDCEDGSDEEFCVDEPGCAERSHGQCKNGRCVYKFSDCTGRDSCGDGSRNENCTMCRANGFLCPNKRCIHSDEKCTGLDACGDGSSNYNCTSCNNNAVLLPKSNRCIPREDVCSGFDVSGDGESDSNCTVCRQGAMLCANKICVRPELWCNGVDVCGDESSNINCTRCNNNAQLTADHSCVPSDLSLWPSHHTHHDGSLSAHHHFTYGIVIGVFALIAIVSVSVIGLYLIYPSKFRWLQRHGEAGLVM